MEHHPRGGQRLWLHWSTNHEDLAEAVPWKPANAKQDTPREAAVNSDSDDEIRRG
jgi:hypothetical protein